MKIILLPGLDGTGILFKPFLDCAPEQYDVQVLSLKQEPNLSYLAQAKYITSFISDEETVVVAESYSGMVALELSKIQPNIKHIVFVASFLNKPSKLGLFAKLLPLNLIKNRVIPNVVIGRFLFNSYYSRELLELFYQALQSVDNSVLLSRIRQISDLEDVFSNIEIPCTYIGARNDHLISKSVVDKFEEVCLNLAVKQISGSHFLLQTNPLQSWKFIEDIAI